LLGFGRGLGLTVTAEGVEKPAQAIALQKEGCQQAQGYLYSRAMPAADALDFIRNYHANVGPSRAHVA
jgi:EAL domain-containing protein (putative c-di-GMP-specific phosphodiesterase class I)